MIARAAIPILTLVSACSRTIEFPASQVQRLVPLTSAEARAEAEERSHAGVAERLAVGAGEATGILAPAHSVVLYGEEDVEVEGDTELVLRLRGPAEEHPIRPGRLAFGPDELLLHGEGSLAVPYERIDGLDLERFSLGRTILWGAVITVGGFAMLVVLALALGDGNGGGGGDFD